PVTGQDGHAPQQPEASFSPSVTTEPPAAVGAPLIAASPAVSQPVMRPAEGGQVAVGDLAELSSDVPGPDRLEGLQVPALTLEKIAPREIQVGKVATFEFIVRNTGDVTAHYVTVTDRVPQGTQLVAATPDFQQAPDGAIVWQLGSLDPDDEVTISMELMPQAEGEIGSVAHVSFQSQASARTFCTKPELTIEHSTVDSVLIGNDVVFDITISNPGTGEATGIILEADVPPGLTHPMGRKLDNPVGALQPNESRRMELVLAAEQAGKIVNVIRVRGDGGLFSEHRVELEVVAPQLDVVLSGPTRRYLERQVTYQITVANPGTATATNVDLVIEMPAGLQFVSADQEGRYDDRSHSVYWSMAELPPQEQGTVQLTALPVEPGEQTLLVKGEADLGLEHQIQHTTTVEAITEVEFSVSDVQDPIEVGAETTYDVRVVNNGSKKATNVQLAAVLTDGIAPMTGEGPTRVQIEGQQILMDPIPVLEPGEEAIYRLRVQGDREGDHILRVQLTSDEAPNPVTKEEGTRVYADQ
ncbi:MAG: hypothetical protein ACC628_25400, partial [Pirellulaceae bacterium]